MANKKQEYTRTANFGAIDRRRIERLITLNREQTMKHKTNAVKYKKRDRKSVV